MIDRDGRDRVPQLRSIRNRLTLWYAFGLGITLLITGASAYVFTRAALIQNLDQSLQNEVRWVNDFIEPKAKRVRLKRPAVLELRELRRTAAQQPTPPEDSLDIADAETDAMWREIYRHTLLTPAATTSRSSTATATCCTPSQSLGPNRLEHTNMPYKWIQVITTSLRAVTCAWP